VKSGDQVRVAVVGAARMGRSHLRAFAGTRGAAPAAVVEPVTSVREELAAAGLRTYANVEELLAAGGADAALIAAPTDLHVELVAEPAAAGLPILSEKPCGLRAV
jgi:myo-inositol 2-dehydrogenase/D-chiro-inositol 1-dehydrogenase